jgi:soluble lytic murein transglycosylase
VQQIRAGDSITATRMITLAADPPQWDPTQAEKTVLAWLRAWTPVPGEPRLDGHPVRPELERGQALQAIGLRRAAVDAFDAVRAEAWSDPLALAQLAFFFREQGFHGLAARCAMRLASLSPAGTLLDAPMPLQLLAYPLPYADLISDNARARKLDPLLLAALIRQESLFEPVALSVAGARGLGQVMPATGEGIARSLGVSDFEIDDLFRPHLSIEFAAYYLSVQMKRFQNEILIALAAYNGGPGNALNWQEASGGDLDLFVEVISATESRRYLQTVVQQYMRYEELYRPLETTR